MSWLGWMLVVGAAYLIWQWIRKSSVEAEAPQVGFVRQASSNTVRGGRVMLPADIERAWRAGDYDLARGALQKYAYGMVGPGVSEDDKARFRTVMTTFAQDDPLYQEVMAKLKPIVLAQPGILQSSIYVQLPQYDQETVRYVAYFGHEIGDIHRKKKGRSYELLPPGRIIDGETTNNPL